LRTDRRSAVQGVGELLHQSRQLVDFARVPRRKDGVAHPLARRVNELGHGLALGRGHRLAHAAIGGARPTPRQAEAFKLRHLTADGRVVASDAAGELDDADRTEPLDSDQQREQRAIQRDPRLRDQRLVALRQVHRADNFEGGEMKRAEPLRHMCILHFLG